MKAKLLLTALLVCASFFQSVHSNTAGSSSSLQASIVSITPPNPDTYIIGEILSFSVFFSEPVIVDTTFGSPAVSFQLGTGESRDAVYVSGSGGTQLVFEYVVVEDLDAENPNAILITGVELNGGFIITNSDNMPADLSFGFPIGTSAVIDAVRPTIIGVQPPAPNTYGSNNFLEFFVSFSEDVSATAASNTSVTIPLYFLPDANNQKTATLQSGEFTDNWVFNYNIMPGDDGEVIYLYQGGRLELNAGILIDSNGNEMSFEAFNFMGQGPIVDVLVDTTRPVIQSVTGVPGIYETGETIVYNMVLDETVFVDTADGTPFLTVDIGGNTRQFPYVGGSGTNTLSFEFTVQTSDQEDDAIGINGYFGNGGIISDAAGNLISGTIDTTEDPLVQTNDKPNLVRIYSLEDKTYTIGEEMLLIVEFNENVNVDTTNGVPSVGFELGNGELRQATYRGFSGLAALFFEYTVTEGVDLEDEDALSIVSLNLNGGLIQDEHTAENVIIAGDFPYSTETFIDAVRPTITMVVPPSPNVYGEQNNLDFAVTFSEEVLSNASSNSMVRLPLYFLPNNIDEKTATLQNGDGSDTWFFQYDIEPDEEGEVIYLYQGGRIENFSANEITDVNGNEMTFEAYNFEGQGPIVDVIVDAVSPTLVDIIGVPGSYGIGETIRYNMIVDEVVNIDTSDGTAFITVEIGENTRQFPYTTGSGTNTLSFEYTVQANDQEDDALLVNGYFGNGSIISDAGGNLLGGSLDNEEDPLVRVNFSPIVEEIAPPPAGTYQINETLTFTTAFSQDVLVNTDNGSPIISFNLGNGAARFATYVSGSGTSNLVFEYTILENTDLEDLQAIGITGFELNGSTIITSEGFEADITFSFPIATSVFVDAVRPTITEVIVPTAGDYGVGDQLAFNIIFSEEIDADTAEGIPTIDLLLNGTARSASFESGSGSNNLTFVYTVSIDDTDGIAEFASANPAINLNGASISDLPGNEMLTTDLEFPAGTNLANVNILLRPFITTWETVVGFEAIFIPTQGEGYNYIVDWGDGEIESDLTEQAVHIYETAGVHTVKIYGEFPRIFFNNKGVKDKILSVEAWGDIAWANMNSAFWGCSKLIVNATDAPDLNNVTNMGKMFRDATTMTGDFSNWDVSTVQVMNQTFRKAASFNGDISGWDVARVKRMNFMFDGAVSFNQNLGAWNVSKVTKMSKMFLGVTLSIDNYDALLNGWSGLSNLKSNVNFDAGSSVYCVGESARDVIISTYGWTIDDGGLLCPGNPFVTTWMTTEVNENITIPTNGNGYSYTVDWGDGTIDTNVIGDASHVYADPGAHSIEIDGNFPRIFFNNAGDKDKIVSIDAWGSIKWTSMLDAFRGCSNLQINAADSPDLSLVTNMNNMFLNASTINADLSEWDVSTVDRMNRTFKGAVSFDQNIGTWDVSNVAIMDEMFDGVQLSEENYDNLLIGWNALASLQPNVMFSGGISEYCAGELARDQIITNYGWNIADGGISCTDSFNIRSLEVAENSILDVGVYPIPARDVLYINTPEKVQISKASVYDFSGRLVSETESSRGKTIKFIDLSKLPTTGYLLILESSEGTIRRQIIKE